jgi:hypothetical protein
VLILPGRPPDTYGVFVIPDPDLVPICVRGVRSGAATPDGLTEVQAGAIEAVAAGVFHHPIDDPATLEPISPAELAAAVTDPAMRHQLVVGMLSLSLMAHPPDPTGPDRIGAFARAMEVDEGMLAATRRYVEGHRRWMFYDFARNSVFRTLLAREVDERGIMPLVRQIGALKSVSEDEGLVERFRTLEGLPAGSWGRALWDFYQLEQWPLPGAEGAVPQATSEHDWVHVLSGYPPTPLGEIQVTAFMAANAPDDVAFSILFLAMGVYETGAISIPLGPSHVGTLASVPDGPAQLADALRRGAACTADSLLMDHWAMAERPLAEVRDELNVGPKHLPGEDPVPAVPTLVVPQA